MVGPKFEKCFQSFDCKKNEEKRVICLLCIRLHVEEGEGRNIVAIS